MTTEKRAMTTKRRRAGTRRRGSRERHPDAPEQALGLVNSQGKPSTIGLGLVNDSIATMQVRWDADGREAWERLEAAAGGSAPADRQLHDLVKKLWITASMRDLAAGSRPSRSAAAVTRAD